ncbi:HEAT repeat domain-containing protein [Fictibacillus sp. UD]|uniref:HEAT repeat domain-containing protein n=1 Tax=Fictibacillus sp. UD TaxID=3038777 RepID=UPI003745F50B
MLSQEIERLVWAAAILLCALTIMFLYLVIKKALEIRKEKHIQKYMDHIHGTIYGYLYQDKKSRHLLPDSSVKFTAIERLLTNYSTVLEGEGKEKITQLADELFKSRYESILRRNKWSSRMNVLYKIDGFRMTVLNEVLKEMIKDYKITKDEKLIIFRCLAYSNNDSLSALFQYISVPFSVLEYRSIINRMDDIAFGQIVSDYHLYPENLQLAIIDIIGIQKKLDFVHFLEGQLDDKQFEIRIRSMKAIGEVGFLSDSLIVERFAQSQQWEERLMAAKVIGKTRVRNGLDVLDILIKDSSWMVRAQAAKAFLSYTDGLERLYDIRFTSDDPFARDMASEWIERGIEDGYSY